MPSVTPSVSTPPNRTDTLSRTRTASAVRDRKPRTTREIALAAKAIHLWVNEGSVPAAVARMGTMDPPLQLVQQGENDRGHPLYILAPTETSL